MKPDKESSPNGTVLLILSVKKVFVHVAKFRARCAKSLFARKAELREGAGCSIVG